MPIHYGPLFGKYIKGAINPVTGIPAGSRKKKTKRKTRRSTRTNINSLSIRGRSTVPDKLFTTMVFSETALMNPNAVPDYRLYQSSLYDPRWAVGGDQPLGRDQWAAFYNQYRTYAMAYEVTFYNLSTTEQAVGIVVPKGNDTISTVTNTIFEKPYSKYCNLGVEGSGQAIKVVKGYVPGPRTLGMTRNQFSSEKATSSEFTDSPAEQFYLHIYTDAANETSSISVRIRVRITYYVGLFDRIPLGGS